jgi:hypothetical protein
MWLVGELLAIGASGFGMLFEGVGIVEWLLGTQDRLLFEEHA